MRLALRLLIAPLILPLSLALMFPQQGHAADREYHDRVVDQAALSSKLSAIRALRTMLKQRRGTSEEARLDMVLAELLRDCAEFQFRIAHRHDLVKSAPTGVDLRNYRNLLQDSVNLLTEFIGKYPNDAKIARAYYLRGKALLELGRSAEASRDFQTLLVRYRGSSDFKLAALDEMDLLMALKDYAGVLRYVDVLRATPADHEYYALSLDRSGWANYYLNNIPLALQALQKEVRYLNSTGARASQGSRRSALDGIALFYSTGIANKVPGYSALSAYSYFSSISSGPDLGDMLTQIAYLMRAKGRDDDLEAMTVMALAAGPLLPEQSKLDLILITFENEVNHYRYVPLKRSITELDQWCTRNRAALASQSQLQSRARKAIAEAAAPLQRAFVEYKNMPDDTPIGGALISLYSLALRLPDLAAGDMDKRMKVHFDMAEISFALKNYSTALFHYQWVVDHRSGRGQDVQQLVAQSALKAISSKYELLSAKGIFPTDLQAKPLNTRASASLSEDARLWIKKVDEFMSGPASPDRAKGEVFLFEASRLLYSFGNVSEATDRMLNDIPRYSDSKFATASAALVLDTYVASQDWDKTYDVGGRVLSARQWSPDFQSKVRGVIGDASFKRIEAQYKSKNYSEVIARSGEFLKLYPENPNRDNCVLLAANSSLALKDKAGALGYFSMLHAARPELAPQILLTRIALAEEKRDYGSASKYLQAYLAKSDSSADSELRKKAALYEFLESDTKSVSARLQDKGVCVEETAAYCAHLDIVARLNSGEIPARAEEAAIVRKALAGGPDRAIWGVIALRRPGSLTLDQRKGILDAISGGWDSEEPIARFALIPQIPSVVIGNMEAVRKIASSSGKIRHIRKNLIDRRVSLVANVEKMGQKSMKMPWVSVRAGALRQLAGVYSDFSSEVGGIPAPAGLAGQDLTDYKSMIAQMTGVFDKKSVDFEKQAADLESAYKPELDRDSLLRLVAQFAKSIESSGAGIKSLVALWVDALAKSEWGNVAFFMNQMKSAGLSSQSCSFAEAISIYSAGAQAEGLAEIRSIQSDLPRALKRAVASTFASDSSRRPANDSEVAKKGGSS